MNQERFNPSNSEYKKVEDLPPGQQKNFVNVGDGFVRQSALETKERAMEDAKRINELRSDIDKFNGTNEVSPRDILEKEAVVFINERGENFPEITSGQIEEARQDMEADLLKQKKIEIVSKVLLDDYSIEVDKIVIAINQNLQGRAGSVDVWEGMKNKLSSLAYSEMQKLEDPWTHDETPEPAVKKERKWGQWKDESIFSKLSDEVDELKFFEYGRYMERVPPSIQEGTGVNIVAIIQERGSELTGQELEEMEACLRLYTLLGSYKYFGEKACYGYLHDAISLQEELSKKNNEFDPRNAGFFDIKQNIENALAALQLDFSSKPNYPYAHPEYLKKHEDCLSMLASLSKIHARQYLKYRDIELQEDIK